MLEEVLLLYECSKGRVGNSRRVSLPDYVVEAARRETGETIAVTTLLPARVGKPGRCESRTPVRRRWEDHAAGSTVLRNRQLAGGAAGLSASGAARVRRCSRADRDSFVAFDIGCLVPAGREPPTPPPKIARF